ncbi:MAG: hypothetical protein C4530_22985 [Desulfobacteraceae bacterium]|nr:MAG: hypothetical protein C4530_22985 [Desulfobacteraceae bacterium]
MIDLHSHILPDIDDGPEEIEESIEMARIAFSDGIRAMVATPHTLNSVYINRYAKILHHVEGLRDELAREKIGLEIYPGADVHLCVGLFEKVRDQDAATIGGKGKYMLVEFPHQSIPDWHGSELFKLKINGITPIITHPERNSVFQQQETYASELIRMGCLLQITAMSITGDFGREAMECAHRLLINRQAHVIASDAHSSGNRPPILSQAVGIAARILESEKEAQEMVIQRPRAILAGLPVEVPAAREAGRRKWWFW